MLYLHLLKKLYTIFAFVLILIVFGVWSPWNDISVSWLSVFGVDTDEKQGGLKVLSHADEIDIYIDDEYIDTTISNTDFLETPPIQPGEHTVKLVRNIENTDYVEIVRKLNFESGVDVIIGYEIGPSEVFSEGHILYAKKNYSGKDKTVLDIFSEPQDIKVTMDGQYLGETPIRELTIGLERKHLITFEKDGYDSLDIEILPDTSEERDKLKGLKLILEVNLFAQPVEIVTK